MFSQISGDGSRVVSNTRRTAAEVVAGTTDSDISFDVFANDVDSGCGKSTGGRHFIHSLPRRRVPLRSFESALNGASARGTRWLQRAGSSTDA
ncbi:MAG: hypothetical protein RLZZ326_3713 [Planctomycetota bacterium]|jgi:hypothetical protein